MAKRKSVFSSSKEEMATLSVKVPKSLKERADRLAEEIKTVDRSLSFNTSQILQTAYEDAVQAAEAEIAQLKKRQPGGIDVSQVDRR